MCMCVCWCWELWFVVEPTIAWLRGAAFLRNWDSFMLCFGLKTCHCMCEQDFKRMKAPFSCQEKRKVSGNLPFPTHACASRESQETVKNNRFGSLIQWQPCLLKAVVQIEFECINRKNSQSQQITNQYSKLTSLNHAECNMLFCLHFIVALSHPPLSQVFIELLVY